MTTPTVNFTTVWAIPFFPHQEIQQAVGMTSETI